MKILIKRILKIPYYYFLFPLLVNLGYHFAFSKRKYAIVGATETAGVLCAFKEMYGNSCIAYSRMEHPHYQDSKYDLTVKNTRLTRLIRLPFIFGSLVKKASCLIYAGGTPFTLYKEKELKFLKKHNIPIIEIFLGSEIRSPKLFMETANHDSRNHYFDYISNVDIMDYEAKKMAELADDYADCIFSHKNDQISYLKSKIEFFPPLFNQSKINYCMDKFKKLEKIKILHAPSNPIIKGTPVVRAAIKRLKADGYDFEYIELMGVDNSLVIEYLKASHIVLNQFYLLIPGIFGLESMANCNAVLMSANPNEFPYMFNDAWMETTDWQLYGNLKYLLDNPEEIKRFAENGYNYICNNFNKIKIKNYLDVYFKKYMLL